MGNQYHWEGGNNTKYIQKFLMLEGGCGRGILEEGGFSRNSRTPVSLYETQIVM